MNFRTKKILFILAGVSAASLLAALFLVLTFDINSYKTQIESAASEATGMKVSVNGKLSLSLFPGAGVTFEDILMQKNGVDAASVEKAEVEFKLLPLVRREILVQQVKLFNPRLFIVKDLQGRLNIEKIQDELAGKKPYAKPFEVEKISVKNAQIHYLDEKTGFKGEANDCGLELRDLAVAREEPVYASSFEGDLFCSGVELKELKISDLRVVIKASDGKLEASLVTMKIFGGDATGSVKAVMSGESREFIADFAIAKFRFEEVLRTFKKKESIAASWT